MIRPLLVFPIAVLLSLGSAEGEQQPYIPGTPLDATFEDIAYPFFDRYCFDCHRYVSHGERGISLLPYQDQ